MKRNERTSWNVIGKTVALSSFYPSLKLTRIQRCRFEMSSAQEAVARKPASQGRAFQYGE